MKRKIFFIVALLITISSNALAVAVTFNVDMTGQTVNPTGVHIAGNFNDVTYDGITDNQAYVNWNPSGIALVNQGNGIWKVTLNLVPERYEFKFINGNDWSGAEDVPQACQVEVNGNDNRFWTISGANPTASMTVCYESCAACGENTVRFRVDMTQESAGVNLAGVFVAGDFNGWNPAGSQLIDPDGDGIYEGYFSIGTAASAQYRFINGNYWTFVESVPGACAVSGNREITLVQANTVVDITCFGGCGTCVSPTPVLFRVDMSLQTVNANGPHVAGIFQGWNPGDANTLMTDPDGDNIYEVTLLLQPGTYQYKFLNGDEWADGNESLPADCNVGGNREVVVAADPVVEHFCYSQCGAECFTDPAFQTNDPAILSYEGDLNTCGNANVAVLIQNNGTSPLTACTFTVTGGITPLVYNWTGYLTTYAADTVNLGNVTLTGPSNLNVAITSADDNISNNAITTPISYAVEGTTHVKIDILFDGYPEESSWFITDEVGNVVAAADYSSAPIPADYSSKIEDIFLPSSGCYTFTAVDIYGDGFYEMQYPGVANGHIYLTSLSSDGTTYSSFWSYDGTYNFSLEEKLMNVTAFSYGNLDNNTVALCSGENTQIAMTYEPVGLPSYSLQWYYKSGVVNAPFGSSTSGWIAIPGATTSVVDVNSFVGSRTYACFVTTDGSMGLMSQWANGVSYVNYSSINAQAIIGNPNITPFNTYTYAVNAAAGHTYNWTVTNGAVISGQGTSVVSILWGQNGPYQVTLTESDGTCSGTSVLFAVNNNCTLAVSAASATTTSFCSGASVQLQAATTATNITYQWYLNGVAIAGETNQNTAATLGGNYQVSITQNGCSAISQILAITELPGITMPTLVVDQLNAGCSGSEATVSLTDANYSSITWSNGTVNTSSISVSESGSYTVTVTDNNGCTATSSAVEVNLSLVDVVPICLVTVDQTTGKNNVVWEPVTSDMINFYVVLKETNVANVYAQIGTVAYGSNGLFEDVNSNPQVQANRYKLALIDTCGILSSNSDFHKTIHLSTNQGLGNNVNLIWSGYEGFDFGSYNIYRGASAATMTLLTTIASNLDSYTDINPPVGDVYYMIEVEGVSCDPQRTLVYSHSNILDASVGVEEFASTSISLSLSPNPAKTNIMLQVNTIHLGQEYVVFDAIGKVIYKNKIQSTNEIIHLENFNNGNYFVKVNDVVKRFVVQH